MKKLSIIILLLLSSLLGFSQAGVVYDPTNGVTLMNQLTESTKQTIKLKEQVSLMQKSYDTMKEANESVSKVNGILKEMEQVQKVVKLSKTSIKNIAEIESKIKGMDNLETSYKLNALRCCATYTKRILRAIKDIENILTNNKLKMKDKSRLDLLKETTEEMESTTRGVCRIDASCNRMAEMKNLFKKL